MGKIEFCEVTYVRTTHRRTVSLASVIFCFFGFVQQHAWAQDGAPAILRHILENSDTTRSEIELGSITIERNAEMVSFYRQREYALAWISQQDILELLTAIRQAGEEGLNPGDYRLNLLEVYGRFPAKRLTGKVYFDLLLTDAYIRYGTHLHSGKIIPGQLFPGEWKTGKGTADMGAWLASALRDRRIGESLNDLKPKQSGYGKLKIVLHFFRTIRENGGWPVIPEGNPLEPGACDSRVPLIRRRLFISGQLPQIDTVDSLKYDSVLLVALKKFQHTHGLRTDGVIGPGTLEALNYSITDYINTILVNIERYRWLPDQWGDTYVAVNIPSFGLQFYECDSLALSMRAIVGRPDRRTPVFSSVIRYIILNPTWTVPPTVLKEDVLPAVQQNIQYLKKNSLKVFDHLGEEISPDSLPWSTYSVENFPYSLRQDPGQYNSMGLIKFQFPNQHRIFIHDTNLHARFFETNRALSSGCIRIEQPFALAVRLLAGTTWTENKLRMAISSGETRTVSLQKQIPVHLFYFTAYVDEGNEFQMRKDIYEYDAIVLRNLVNGLVQ